MTAEKRWTADQIPQRWRGFARVEPDGTLFLNLRSPNWVKPQEALQLVVNSLGVDAAAAVEALKIRAASGHLILAAGAVTGYLGDPIARIRLSGGREMLLPEVWHFGAAFADVGKAFWATGDAQLRLIDPAWGITPRVRTYTDVRFLELNLKQMTGSDLIDQPTIADGIQAAPPAPSPSDDNTASRRGRPRGVGSYAIHDAPLLDEMAGLIERGEALSPNAAAAAVAGRARGGGSSDAKLKRLRDAYKAREKNGAN